MAKASASAKPAMAKSSASAKPEGRKLKVKKVQIGRTGPKLNKMSLSSALTSALKEQSGRGDLDFRDAPGGHVRIMDTIPIKERAGYPLVIKKGSVDPAKWRSSDGKEVFVDFSRAAWLPDEWGQGVKITERIERSTGGGGGTLTCYCSPDGKVYYHKHTSAAWAGYKFDSETGFNGQIRSAQLRAKETIQVVRSQIRDIAGPASQKQIGTDSDSSFFAILDKKERACVAPKSKFHFAVVSARRATKVQGVQDIFAVQSQLVDAGVTPTWYVDEDSVQDYRKLGLNAVVGGKLTPSRNKALEDAHRLGKVCVQISDDIAAWEYRHGKNAEERTDDAANKAHAEAKRYIISPVAAAQFILAKMRGAPEEEKPHLGGVYMLGSCARTFGSAAFAKKHFIIGDFFVADVAKELKCKFDAGMTLKEDYDFTCQHIRKYGSVMRCNRLTLNVKHYSNDGGACTNRDGKGAAERRNIEILMSRWPRSFRKNPKRQNEVIMRWPADGDAEGRHQKTPKRRPVKEAEEGEDSDQEDQVSSPAEVLATPAKNASRPGKTPSASKRANSPTAPGKTPAASKRAQAKSGRGKTPPGSKKAKAAAAGHKKAKATAVAHKSVGHKVKRRQQKAN